MVLLAMSLVSSGQERGTEAHGTVRELMIGIIDPSTNIVGYAAFIDPEAPTDEPGFDPFGGWVKVRGAAVAMTESATLLAMPGRLCTNGLPAPVDQDDWIEWTEDLRVAGLAGYEAARNESQEEVLEISEQLTTSCTGCHTRYLDVGGDPENRCMP